MSENSYRALHSNSVARMGLRSRLSFIPTTGIGHVVGPLRHQFFVAPRPRGEKYILGKARGITLGVAIEAHAAPPPRNRASATVNGQRTPEKLGTFSGDFRSQRCSFVPKRSDLSAAGANRAAIKSPIALPFRPGFRAAALAQQMRAERMARAGRPCRRGQRPLCEVVSAPPIAGGALY
jgi:hypothetical protein